VFQIETPIQKGIIRDGKVKSFNDLVVYNAMGRPGPIEAIPEFIRNRDDPEKKWMKGMDSRIIKILNDTHGVICFQEDLCMIWRVIAKFSVPEAEAYRKIIAKKWVDKLVELENRWKSGAAEVIGKKAADEYWIIMRTFGRYAFNKCLSIDNKVKDSITGEEITIGELRDRTNFHLLSLGENELFHDTVEEVIDCGNQDVYEIMLDNGVKMEVTMDHKFLCTNGQYKTVREIVENGYEIREANVAACQCSECVLTCNQDVKTCAVCGKLLVLTPGCASPPMGVLCCECAYKEITQLTQRIEEMEKGLTEIAKWSQADQDDPQICVLHWRGCVAIARNLLFGVKING
jgi:hypothetical protein